MNVFTHRIACCDRGVTIIDEAKQLRIEAAKFRRSKRRGA
jgi:hypothetical protein